MTNCEGEKSTMYHLFESLKQSLFSKGQTSKQKEQPPEPTEQTSETTEQPSETSEQEHTLDELLDICEGAACEVQTKDNNLLFAGYVAHRNPDFKAVTIEPRKNCEAPMGIKHGTSVKLQVRVRAKWGNLVMLYGTVSACSEDQWNIFIENAVACTESRKAFRQRVDVDAKILSDSDFSFQGNCHLEDISLVGVGFFSDLELELEQPFILSIPCLLENSHSYQLSCTVASVRNVSQPDESPSWRYGCAFDTLNEEVENALYKDIMTLQQSSRSK